MLSPAPGKVLMSFASSLLTQVRCVSAWEFVTYCGPGAMEPSRSPPGRSSREPGLSCSLPDVFAHGVQRSRLAGQGACAEGGAPHIFFPTWNPELPRALMGGPLHSMRGVPGLRSLGALTSGLCHSGLPIWLLLPAPPAGSSSSNFSPAVTSSRRSSLSPPPAECHTCSPRSRERLTHQARLHVARGVLGL